MTDKESNKGLQIILYVVLMIWAVSCFTGATYLYQKGIAMTCRVGLLTVIGFGCVIYTIVCSYIKKDFQYDKEKHIVRSGVIFAICVVIASLLPLIPYLGWVFPVIALVLALFSNTVIGLTSVSILIGMSVVLSQIPTYVGLLYFVSSLCFILLFENLDEKYETGLRTFTAMLLYTVVLMICVVFQEKEQLDMEDFMIPVIGLFANFVLLTAVLRMYSVLVIHRLKDRYAIINDQEYDLIKQYKEEKEVYFHAIHTAYFCEKIARALHMNSDLAKAGGYYHKIVELTAKNDNVSIHDICIKHNFPEELEQLLDEYMDKAKPICQKEATVLLFADTIVSSVQYILQKEPDTVPDYPKIIHALFKRKEDSGILNKSNISVKELRSMEQIFAGEKLYYDFLR